MLHSDIKCVNNGMHTSMQPMRKRKTVSKLNAQENNSLTTGSVIWQSYISF